MPINPADPINPSGSKSHRSALEGGDFLESGGEIQGDETFDFGDPSRIDSAKRKPHAPTADEFGKVPEEEDTYNGEENPELKDFEPYVPQSTDLSVFRDLIEATDALRNVTSRTDQDKAKVAIESALEALTKSSLSNSQLGALKVYGNTAEELINEVFNSNQNSYRKALNEFQTEKSSRHPAAVPPLNLSKMASKHPGGLPPYDSARTGSNMGSDRTQPPTYRASDASLSSTDPLTGAPRGNVSARRAMFDNVSKPVPPPLGYKPPVNTGAEPGLVKRGIERRKTAIKAHINPLPPGADRAPSKSQKAVAPKMDAVKTSAIEHTREAIRLRNIGKELPSQGRDIISPADKIDDIVRKRLTTTLFDLRANGHNKTYESINLPSKIALINSILTQALRQPYPLSDADAKKIASALIDLRNNLKDSYKHHDAQKHTDTCAAIRSNMNDIDNAIAILKTQSRYCEDGYTATDLTPTTVPHDENGNLIRGNKAELSTPSMDDQGNQDFEASLTIVDQAPAQPQKRSADRTSAIGSPILNKDSQQRQSFMSEIRSIFVAETFRPENQQKFRLQGQPSHPIREKVALFGRSKQIHVDYAHNGTPPISSTMKIDVTPAGYKINHTASGSDKWGDYSRVFAEIAVAKAATNSMSVGTFQLNANASERGVDYIAQMIAAANVSGINPAFKMPKGFDKPYKDASGQTFFVKGTQTLWTCEQEAKQRIANYEKTFKSHPALNLPQVDPNQGTYNRPRR